jgi:hypothetical protein
MSDSVSSVSAQLNDWLAKLMTVGTWFGCALIAVGTILLVGHSGLLGGPPAIISAGIAIIIALPILRVLTMAWWFLLRRDLQFATIALGVFAVIAISTYLGIAAA